MVSPKIIVTVYGTNIGCNEFLKKFTISKFKRLEKIYDCNRILRKPPKEIDIHTPIAPHILPNKRESGRITKPIKEKPIALIFILFLANRVVFPIC